MGFRLLILLALVLFSPPEGRCKEGDPVDTREMDTKMHLRLNHDNNEEVLKYSVVSFGEHKINHTGDPLVNPKGATGTKRHKTKPPIIGSSCLHELYDEIYGPYFALDYKHYIYRLYEHKKIEHLLELENDDALAWSLCQYSGIKMMCGKKRRCECLKQGPPFEYIQRGAACLGAAGSECTTTPAAPVLCDAGLKCIEGFCGGIKVAYNKLVGTGVTLFPSVLLTLTLPAVGLYL